MPQIKPASIQDLLKFVNDHRPEIENNTYDILLENEHEYANGIWTLKDSWVDQIPNDTMYFLIKHCPSSRLSIGVYSKEPSILTNLYLNHRETYSYIAGNPSTPPKIISILSMSPDENVRMGVAQNMCAPPDVLEILARDGSEEVRYRVAINPCAPPNVYKVLDYNIRYRAALESSIIKVGTDTLEKLSTDPEIGIRMTVASNSKTPAHVLKALSSDSSHDVRIEVAKNANTPRGILEILSRDTNADVRAYAVGNPNAPSSIKKSCFIATAIYGSEMAPEVILLREYRDHVLKKQWLGKWLVVFYYIVAPFISSFIGKVKPIKYLVKKMVLDPFVRIISS